MTTTRSKWRWAHWHRIGIVQAQAQVATAQQALIVAQTAQLQEQTLLMSVITKNPTAPNLLNVEIVPTDSVQNLPPVENLTLQDAVTKRWPSGQTWPRPS